MEYVVIGWMISIFLAVIGAFWMTDVAERKGYDSSKEHIWLRVFFLGLFGIPFVIALPDKIAQNNQKRIISLLENLQDQSKIEADKEKKEIEEALKF